MIFGLLSSSWRKNVPAKPRVCQDEARFFVEDFMNETETLPQYLQRRLPQVVAEIAIERRIKEQKQQHLAYLIFLYNEKYRPEPKEWSI